MKMSEDLSITSENVQDKKVKGAFSVFKERRELRTERKVIRSKVVTIGERKVDV